MVLTYVCTCKCFFKGAVRNPGDRLVLDQKEGDACVHLVPEEKDRQLADMQRSYESDNTLGDKPVASPKVSVKKRTTTTNGGKAK